MIVKAWIACSIDAITRAEQSGKIFYKRVHARYHEHRKYGKSFESTRSENSLMKRWRTIQTECNKFCGALAQVKKCPPSGASMEDMVHFLHKLSILMFIVMSIFILMFILVAIL